MGVAWGVLQQWQDRAMEGMLLALQPRVQVERGVALSPRLAVLLEKKLYLAEKTIEVKDLLSAYDLHEAKKNKTKQQKGGRRQSGK